MSKYTKDLLMPLVKNSFSMSEVLSKLELKVSGGNHSHIKRLVQKYDIDINHFLKGGAISGKNQGKRRSKAAFINEVLNLSGGKVTSHGIKLKLYEFNLKEEICEACGVTNIWNGYKLSLHLDHINGEHSDNRLENLRILCPNCHSQTSTYAGKGKKSKVSKQTKKIKCLECNNLISTKAIRCKSCAGQIRQARSRAFTLPTKNELIKLLHENNFTKVGKIFGVSDNAVRKWAKSYGIL